MNPIVKLKKRAEILYRDLTNDNSVTVTAPEIDFILSSLIQTHNEALEDAAIVTEFHRHSETCLGKDTCVRQAAQEIRFHIVSKEIKE